MTEKIKRRGNPAWQPGTSANPAGRPRGALDRRAQWRAELGEALPEIMAALVTAAKRGDTAAAGLILSRVAPPLRPAREAVALPGLIEAETLAARAKAVLDAVASGAISSDQASELLAAVAAVATAIEVDQLAARLKALERGVA